MLVAGAIQWCKETRAFRHRRQLQMVTAHCKERNSTEDFRRLCIAGGVQFISVLPCVCGPERGSVQKRRCSLQSLIMDPTANVRLVGIHAFPHLVGFDV